MIIMMNKLNRIYDRRDEKEDRIRDECSTMDIIKSGEQWREITKKGNEERRTESINANGIGNNIGYEGAIMMSEELKTNSTLTELNLSC